MKHTGNTTPERVATAAENAARGESLALRGAFHAMRKKLEQAGVPDAAFDAAQLLHHITGIDYRLQPDTPLTPAQTKALQALAQRRAAREPLQYLLGTWDFLNFTLCVGQGVLIPRADTEIVCETAIAAARACMAAAGAQTAEVSQNGQNCLCKVSNVESPSQEGTFTAGSLPASSVRVIDLCAGSGAIAVGVARAVPQAMVTAVELSDSAFCYLQQNATALAPQIAQIKADVFSWQDTLPEAWADVIVSNPPYIAPQEMKTLAPELAFEPRMALEAGENGLSFYFHIARAYHRVLRAGGVLVFEIGSGQAPQVSAILCENGYEAVVVLPDAAGLPRCVSARKPV